MAGAGDDVEGGVALIGAIERLREWVSHLAGPQNWNELVDLLSKSPCALASALIAAGVWLYSDYQERLEIQLAKQEVRHERELSRAREGLSERRDVINLFLQFMPKDFSDPQLSLKVETLSSYCSENSELGDRAGWSESCAKASAGSAMNMPPARGLALPPLQRRLRPATTQTFI